MMSIPQPSAKQKIRLLNFKMALGEKRYNAGLALLGIDSDVDLDMRDCQRLLDIFRFILEGRWCD